MDLKKENKELKKTIETLQLNNKELDYINKKLFNIFNELLLNNIDFLELKKVYDIIKELPENKDITSQLKEIKNKCNIHYFRIALFLLSNTNNNYIFEKRIIY